MNWPSTKMKPFKLNSLLKTVKSLELRHKIKLGSLALMDDSKLSGKQHTDQLSKRVCLVIYVIRQILQASDLQSAKTAYLAMIALHRRYSMYEMESPTPTWREFLLINQISKKPSRVQNSREQQSLRSLQRPYNSQSIISLHLGHNPTQRLKNCHPNHLSLYEKQLSFN